MKLTKYSAPNWEGVGRLLRTDPSGKVATLIMHNWQKRTYPIDTIVHVKDTAGKKERMKLVEESYRDLHLCKADHDYLGALDAWRILDGHNQAWGVSEKSIFSNIDYNYLLNWASINQIPEVLQHEIRTQKLEIEPIAERCSFLYATLWDRDDKEALLLGYRIHHTVLSSDQRTACNASFNESVGIALNSLMPQPIIETSEILLERNKIDWSNDTTSIEDNLMWAARQFELTNPAKTLECYLMLYSISRDYALALNIYTQKYIATRLSHESIEWLTLAVATIEKLRDTGSISSLTGDSFRGGALTNDMRSLYNSRCEKLTDLYLEDREYAKAYMAIIKIHHRGFLEKKCNIAIQYCQHLYDQGVNITELLEILKPYLSYQTINSACDFIERIESNKVAVT